MKVDSPKYELSPNFKKELNASGSLMDAMTWSMAERKAGGPKGGPGVDAAERKAEGADATGLQARAVAAADIEDEGSPTSSLARDPKPKRGATKAQEPQQEQRPDFEGCTRIRAVKMTENDLSCKSHWYCVHCAAVTIQKGKSVGTKFFVDQVNLGYEVLHAYYGINKQSTG